jgi:hypothetical protein
VLLPPAASIDAEPALSPHAIDNRENASGASKVLMRIFLAIH